MSHVGDRREERRKYVRDVEYYVWRSGGSADLDYDRLDDHFYSGVSADEAADDELRRQRRRREAYDDEAVW